MLLITAQQSIIFMFSFLTNTPLLDVWIVSCSQDYMQHRLQKLCVIQYFLMIAFQKGNPRSKASDIAKVLDTFAKLKSYILVFRVLPQPNSNGILQESFKGRDVHSGWESSSSGHWDDRYLDLCCSTSSHRLLLAK